MFSFRKSLLALAGLALAVGLIALFTPTRTQGQGGPPTQNVNVVNTPLPVKDVSVPVPFQSSNEFVNMPDGESVRNFSFDIPEGKMLVVEHVSFRAELPPGQAAAATLRCQGGLAIDPAHFRIPFELEGTFPVEVGETVVGLSLFVANSPVRCYADGSQGLAASVLRNSTTGAAGRINFSFSGHLVAQPPAGP